MNSYKINMFSYNIYIMSLGLKSKAQGIGKKIKIKYKLERKITRDAKQIIVFKQAIRLYSY